MAAGDDTSGGPDHTSSSTPSAYEPPDPVWDRVQAALGLLPSGTAASGGDRDSSCRGLVHVPWGRGGSVAQAIAALARDGAFVLEGAVPAEMCDAVRAQVAPYVDAAAPRSGGAVRRAGAVLGRSRASWPLATHPALLQVCEGVLGRQVLRSTASEVEAQLFADRGFKQHPYNLDLSILIAVEPGGAAQNLHLDAGKHIVDFRPFGLETTLSVMWAIEDFTATNGATQVCLGSRHWPRERRPMPEEAVPAVMGKGSCLVWTGDTWHGSGPNLSAARRWALNIDYSVAWLRQEENQYLAVPPASAAMMPDALLTLLGYSQPSASLGYVGDGEHPLLALRRGGRQQTAAPPLDWAQPLARQVDMLDITESRGATWACLASPRRRRGYIHLDGQPPSGIGVKTVEEVLAQRQQDDDEHTRISSKL
jgi:hypothetical protein